MIRSYILQKCSFLKDRKSDDSYFLSWLNNTITFSKHHPNLKPTSFMFIFLLFTKWPHLPWTASPTSTLKSSAEDTQTPSCVYECVLNFLMFVYFCVYRVCECVWEICYGQFVNILLQAVKKRTSYKYSSSSITLAVFLHTYLAADYQFVIHVPSYVPGLSVVFPHAIPISFSPLFYKAYDVVCYLASVSSRRRVLECALVARDSGLTVHLSFMSWLYYLHLSAYSTLHLWGILL